MIDQRDPKLHPVPGTTLAARHLYRERLAPRQLRFRPAVALESLEFPGTFHTWVAHVEHFRTARARAVRSIRLAPRRTFAIISHPDAGKTTLTEKLLLFGGAIQLAGQVRARGDRRRTRSDWMEIERERGISVTSSVMTFEHDGIVFNLLDTPGHEDFSEDTYRTLTAVDSAVMVIDAAKGIESQTRKLFEVCRLRDIPIITFINKIDREGHDPLALLDEISSGLALDLTLLTWPIGMGVDFRGILDVHDSRLLLPKAERTDGFGRTEALGEPSTSLEHPDVEDRIAQPALENLALCMSDLPKFDAKAFREGHLSPVIFGSALEGFRRRGVARLPRAMGAGRAAAQGGGAGGRAG